MCLFLHRSGRSSLCSAFDTTCDSWNLTLSSFSSLLQVTPSLIWLPIPGMHSLVDKSLNVCRGESILTLSPLRDSESPCNSCDTGSILERLLPPARLLLPRLQSHDSPQPAALDESSDLARAAILREQYSIAET